MSPRVAIVHDYLVQYGGAERVVESLHDLWPDAPVFTSVYEPRGLPDSFAAMDVRTTFLQRLPRLRSTWKAALPLYPAAMSTIDLRGYDLVVSSSSGWAHAVRTGAGAAHLVYCYTPPRWLYRPGSYTGVQRAATAPLRGAFKRWDRNAAMRPDRYVAISSEVRARIRDAYGRDASIVFPPVETGRFAIGEPEDFYLCASRLQPYKRIDLALDACRLLGRRLLVAGDGPDRARLSRRAGEGVELLGRVSDVELASLFARCRALIVPAEEDFCIAAVETMAAGRPVVAYGRGGARDTVVPGTTGVLFDVQTAASLATALQSLETMPVDPEAIRRHALAFDVQRFHDRMRAVADDLLERNG